MTLATLSGGVAYNDEMFQIGGTTALDPVITGGGSLGDASDASYVKVEHTATSSSYAAVDLPTFELAPGSTVESIALNLRVRGNSNHPSPASSYLFRTYIGATGATYDLPGPLYPTLYGTTDIPMTDTFVTVNHPIDQTDITFNGVGGISTMVDLAELFAGGATLHFWVSTPSGYISYTDIAEASVAINYTAPEAPGSLQLRAVPGRTEVQVVAQGRANKIPPQLAKVPGGLYPLMSSAWEVDEYRILAGWPVPVPELDIQIDVTVTGDGTVLGNRDSPTSLITEADLRWVADANYYDVTTLTWTPMQGDASAWQTSTDHAPTLVHDYEYRVGDERFVDMTALNFDSNTEDYMWNDMSLALGGTSGYTVIMVVSPNSIYTNDEAITSNGLWGNPDTDESWVAFSVRNQAVCMTSDERTSQVGVPIRDQLNLTCPTYLAMVVGKPQTTLYAAVGPSGVKVKALVAGQSQTSLRTDFWLGRAQLGSSATIDMALLDLGIYANELSAAQVRREFATLSGVYGGDS